MAKSNEYLERRCVITEAVLHDLGNILMAHLPGLTPYLNNLGKDWTAAVDKLDAEMPDGIADQHQGGV